MLVSCPLSAKFRDLYGRRGKEKSASSFVGRNLTEGFKYLRRILYAYHYSLLPSLDKFVKYTDRCHSIGRYKSRSIAFSLYSCVVNKELPEGRESGQERISAALNQGRSYLHEDGAANLMRIEAIERPSCKYGAVQT